MSSSSEGSVTRLAVALCLLCLVRPWFVLLCAGEEAKVPPPPAVQASDEDLCFLTADERELPLKEAILAETRAEEAMIEHRHRLRMAAGVSDKLDAQPDQVLMDMEMRIRSLLLPKQAERASDSTTAHRSLGEGGMQSRGGPWSWGWTRTVARPSPDESTTPAPRRQER